MSQSPSPAPEANNEQNTALVSSPMPGKPVGLEVGSRGFSLNTLDEAWRFCTAMAASGMMPKGMETAQKVLFALQKGFEVGLPPLAAVQSIAVINGRATLYGDAVLGIVINSGKLDLDAWEEGWVTGPNSEVIGAYCIARRLPNGKPRRWDFTKEDAVKAKLWGKEGPWTNNPRRMMQMRARAFTLRDVFPDVLHGIVTYEEAVDIPPEKNVTPVTSSRPTTLEELTDHLTAPPITTEADADQAANGEASEASASEAPKEALITETGNDALNAIHRQLQECRYVSDISKQRNSWTGPASKLSDLEKGAINAMCDERIAAIKQAKQGVQQGALPTN